MMSCNAQEQAVKPDPLPADVFSSMVDNAPQISHKTARVRLGSLKDSVSILSAIYSTGLVNHI